MSPIGPRTARVLAAVIVVLTLGFTASVEARQTSSKKYAGMLLADVLRDLQARGLKIVFSTELVRADMRVATEPRATAPRKILDEVLGPHGLEVRPGPSQTLLVVKGRRESAADAGTSSTAARGSIAGLVVDARTGAPLPGVAVSVQGTDRQALTNRDGAFDLPDLAAGSHALFVSLVGYGLARPAVTVAAGSAAHVTIPLADGTGAFTDQVTVSATAPRGSSTATPGEMSLTSADLLDLRGVLTDDPFRAIQVLPGVANDNDLLSQFSVRGSDFGHLGFSVDGVPTNWLVHSVRDHEQDGSIAIINGDILDRVTLSSGAYPQERPGHTGARLDFGVREGSRTAFQAHGAVSGSSASLVIEGPFGASKRGSWLVSARQSYLQWLLKRLGQDNTAFGFTDAQSKLVYDVTPRQQLQVTLLGGRSKLDQHDENPGPNSLAVAVAHGGLATIGWRSLLGSSVMLQQRASVGADRSRNDGETQLLATGSSMAATYQAGVSWQLRPSVLVQTDAFVQRRHDTENFVRFIADTTGANSRLRTQLTDGRAWTSSASTRVVWSAAGGSRLDVGVLGANSSLTRETTASPWVLGRWQAVRALAVTAGAGRYQQFPEIDQVVGSFGRPEVRHERARHLEAGVELQPSRTLRALILFYDRQERDMLRLEDSELRVVAGQIVPASQSPFWQNALTGSSRGVELLLDYRKVTGLGGWIGYAHGRTTYTDGGRGETFAGDFDQRHTFNACLQYRTSPQTSVSGKLRVGSNFPLAGYFDERDGQLYGGTLRNTVRLPTYSRLDFRASHTFNYTKRRMTLFVEVLNVLGRENLGQDRGAVFSPSLRAFGFTESLFPFLPSAGFIIDF